jgi:predicted nucleic acid-binding protein
MARPIARGRGRRPIAGPTLVLDSGAVVALAADDPAARAVLTVAVRRGVPVLVPAVVVTETVRGTPRDAPVNHVLAAVGEIVAADERLARAAGGLLGSTGSNAGAVDALVVATAASSGGAVILTGDPRDLGRLARDLPALVIHAV